MSAAAKGQGCTPTFVAGHGIANDGGFKLMRVEIGVINGGRQWRYTTGATGGTLEVTLLSSTEIFKIFK